MSELGLGNLTIDPKTNSPRMTSMSSKIDTEQLTQALYEAKLIPATRIEQKIEVGDAKVKAYGELEGKLEEMRSALDGLRNPPGLAGVEDNLFERKAAYFSSNTTTSPASLLAVQASNRAETGSFDLVVDDLATAHKVMSDGFASADEPLGITAPETLTIGLGAGPTADVAVTADMDVYELRDAINAESATTNVQASVLKVSDGDYRLVLTGRETGATNAIALGGAPETLARLNTADAANELAAAGDAHLRIDDVAVVRGENTITDLMDGLTFDLYQAEPGTTVSVEIEPDFTQAMEAVASFVDAYNGLRDFIDGQRAVGEDGAVDKLASPLFGDSLLRTLGQELGFEVGGAVAGLAAGAPTTLAQIGIDMGEGNRLELDRTKLEETLLKDPAAVRDVLEFQAETSDPGLALYQHPPTLPSTSFQVEKLGDGSWELRDGTHTIALEADGNTLKAPAGSAYDGLVMFWTDEGDPAGPIDVGATQGIADRLYGAIDKAVGEVDGTIEQAIEQTKSQMEGWREDVARIEARAEDHRLMLIDKFARLETALSLSESMLTQVRAQTDAMSADR
jgi:flagellar hook-associated protein 2